MNLAKFKELDVVVRKTGGAKMVVEKLVEKEGNEPSYLCVWYRGNTASKWIFQGKELEGVKGD